MSNVWITHPETGGVAEVPESAVPMYRQSGWDLLSKQDVAAREKTAAAESAAAEKSMQEAALPAKESKPAARDHQKKENG